MGEETPYGHTTNHNADGVEGKAEPSLRVHSKLVIYCSKHVTGHFFVPEKCFSQTSHFLFSSKGRLETRPV